MTSNLRTNEAGYRYCDVALPVPVDRLFTYELPLTLRHRVQRGARVLAPFGPKKLNGVVLSIHDSQPEQEAREILSLRDEEPVLGEDLLELAQWIANYYCAPLGEVLKGMLPLSGETRRNTQFALTDAGRDVARQLVAQPVSDPSLKLLALLEKRSHSAEYVASKVKNAKAVLRALVKRGWVTAEESQEERDPLRARAERLEVSFVNRPLEGVKLTRTQRELIAYLELHPGVHNLAELGEVVKRASEAARSLARRELIKFETKNAQAPSGYEKPIPDLNADQQAAFESIEEAITAGGFASFLLEGVTGSGKTEVYLRAIEATLASERNALLLVPEIALTPAVAGQFFHRFGKQVAILHSAFGDAERAQQWRRIRNGQARVVVGTRSGVFAPVRNLGLLVIDEEHDDSYKQGETPRYNGRDVALMRAKQAGALAILGSATPSVTTRYNATHRKSKLLRLPERIARRPMPQVELVDMRAEFLETKRQSVFSRRLLDELERRLAGGEQSMLLLNRRGFSSFLVCRSCGERMVCEQCSIALTHHRRDRRMLCHYCGYAEKIPSSCPQCGSEYIQFLGTGSERVEDELHQRFPRARVMRLDRDSASGKGAYEKILSAFRGGEVDILVGTQMIAKGHDIPNVTLVGVVLADIGLSVPDFRAAERTFQLLTQVAGRSGRGNLPGQVIIQTLTPDHYAIQYAAAQDYGGFYAKEIEFRKWLRYPPFAALANLVMRAEKQEEALRIATEVGRVLTPAPEGIRVMGPAEAPVLRLRNEYRYQILLKAAQRSVLHRVLGELRAFAEAAKWKTTALTVDVDPISLM